MSWEYGQGRRTCPISTPEIQARESMTGHNLYSGEASRRGAPLTVELLPAKGRDLKGKNPFAVPFRSRGLSDTRRTWFSNWGMKRPSSASIEMRRTSF